MLSSMCHHHLVRRISATIRLHFSTTTAIDSQSLFKQYGLTPSQIATIVTRAPFLARADPDKILKPKLNFLENQGISGENLASLIFKHPSLLTGSLDRKIVPSITFLRSFLRSDSDLLRLLSSRTGSKVVHNFTDSVPVNVESLGKFDVPYENVVKLFGLHPVTLSWDCGEFDRLLREVDGMGIDRKSMMFIHGLFAVSSMSKDKWVKKVEFLRKLGLSEEDVKALIFRQPRLMTSSEEHIKKSFEFLRSEVGWTVVDVLKYPTALMVSFEKTVLPRVSVLKVLFSKGLLKKGYGSSFLVREDVFLEKYVLRHEKEVPEILEVYRKNRNVLAMD